MTLNLTRHWTPKQDEFDRFAAVSGDDNPIHVDPEFSSRTAFGRTVSHGMLIYAKLWGMISEAAPTARQARQTLMFPNPTFVGDEVELTVTGDIPGLLQIAARRPSDGADLLIGEAEIKL